MQLTICGVKLMETFTVIWKQSAEILLSETGVAVTQLDSLSSGKKKARTLVVLYVGEVHVRLPARRYFASSDVLSQV